MASKVKIAVTRADTLKTHPQDSKLGFGAFFTDHMFNMDYHPDKGWYNPRIEPYGPLALDPATIFLHYGQSVYDGHKAYRTPSGSIQLFRPKDHIARINRSAKRMAIPLVDGAFVLEALKQLIAIEKDWVPASPGTALYIRPNIIATDRSLAVRASQAYRFYTILSPVGPYFSEGFKPVKIWVSRDHVRAFPGGLGEAKTPANYAASLLAGEEARLKGYSQVLWLDGIDRRYIEEVGAMNICFVIDGELVTPPLLGTVLPGITRESVLALARFWKMPCSERRISIDEIIEANNQGRLTEVFGCGTAAVISPVGTLVDKDQLITVADGQVGPVASRLYKALTDIQYGRAEDTFGWMEPVVD
jgi:branched-chain amino acid aminotransferase